MGMPTSLLRKPGARKYRTGINLAATQRPARNVGLVIQRVVNRVPSPRAARLIALIGLIFFAVHDSGCEKSTIDAENMAGHVTGLLENVGQDYSGRVKSTVQSMRDRSAGSIEFKTEPLLVSP